ncbi:MAG: hypothetical protein AABO57_10675 [Acidobacteriota bacterium]
MSDLPHQHLAKRRRLLEDVDVMLGEEIIVQGEGQTYEHPHRQHQDP